jgi:hypothetical protein
MIFIYYKDSNNVGNTQKNHSIKCSGWSDSAPYGFSISRVHTAAAEAGGLNWQISSSAALKSLT